MKINLHVWFYFIVFLTILYITCSYGVKRFALSESILFITKYLLYFLGNSKLQTRKLYAESRKCGLLYGCVTVTLIKISLNIF